MSLDMFSLCAWYHAQCSFTLAAVWLEWCGSIAWTFTYRRVMVTLLVVLLLACSQNELESVPDELCNLVNLEVSAWRCGHLH